LQYCFKLNLKSLETAANKPCKYAESAFFPLFSLNQWGAAAPFPLAMLLVRSQTQNCQRNNRKTWKWTTPKQ